MKKEVLKFLVLLMVAVGAGPAGAAIWQWSHTPSNNGTADPTINWAVGMAPSAVDPSARAMMARVAEWRDDISGALITSGTASDYTVTTNQSAGGNGLCPTGGIPPAGTMIAIVPNVTNGTNPYLQVDGCVAIAVVLSYGTFAPPGSLLANTPYQMVLVNPGSPNWVVMGAQGQPNVVPLGAIIAYSGVGAPNGNFIEPVGQCLSTTTYAAYWALVGSPGPGVCPGGQFQVVDLRGRYLAGLDNLSNNGAAGRMDSTAYGCGTTMYVFGAVCANGLQYSQLQTANLPPYTPSGGVSGSASVSSTVGDIVQATALANVQAGSSYYGIQGTIAIGSVASTGSISASFAGNAQGGSQYPFPNIPPTIGVNYIMRVL